MEQASETLTLCAVNGTVLLMNGRRVTEQAGLFGDLSEESDEEERKNSGFVDFQRTDVTILYHFTATSPRDSL